MMRLRLRLAAPPMRSRLFGAPTAASHGRHHCAQRLRPRPPLRYR